MIDLDFKAGAYGDGLMSGVTPDYQDVERLPASLRFRTSYLLHNAGSPINPGFAYGTLVPLWDCKYGIERWFNPYLLPQVSPMMVMNKSGAWQGGGTVDDARTLRIKGLVTDVPIYDFSTEQAIQFKAANQ